MATGGQNWAETAIIAAAAAGITGLFMMRSFDKRRLQYLEDAQKGYIPPQFQGTYLQNPGNQTPSGSDTQGWSMQEALSSSESSKAKANACTPSEVLSGLQKGNSRFYTGQAVRPEVSAFERRTLITQQFPSTAILGCADSRVPVEIVFDQGLGDVFVVRVAGNCLGVNTKASLDYAVHHLKVKVLLVVGHEGCGAIKAAGLPEDLIAQEPEALAKALTNLKSGLDQELLSQIRDPRARDREAVVANVRAQVTALTDDPKVMEKVDDGSLIIVGGFYEISSGIVDFFFEVSKTRDDDFEAPSPHPGVRSRYYPTTKQVQE